MITPVNRKAAKSIPKIGKTDIAIIGIAGRFPGAENYWEFWKNLEQKVCSISEIPEERWIWQEHNGDPLCESNKSDNKWGGFLNAVDAFDASFFGISALEATYMDPQQRIMLELAWACFEDAGIRPSSLSGKEVGSFMASFNYDYKELIEKGNTVPIEAHHATGTATAILANRISYYYNFKGPSITMDAACSGSLNAVHAAVTSLQLEECTVALAGAVNLFLTPTRHISFSKTGMLSPTGRCYSFDDKANGYVRGEGAGILLLKPLSLAIKDRDKIHGIIKSVAVNHSGKTYTLTYPNPDAQADVISKALTRASITPESVSYIETHGTGTPKGDPIEFEGLKKVFSLNAENDINIKHCYLGSVKTNIGHLEAAAGMAGIIKVLLSMKFKKIPAMPGFQKINPAIDIGNSPFIIPEKLTTWGQLNNNARRAGVSSFGFGGTNAHIILEEFVEKNVKHEESHPLLIGLSAKSASALKCRLSELLVWLKENQEHSLLDISATLLKGREHFKYRIAFAVNNTAELIHKLQEAMEKDGKNLNAKLLAVNTENKIDLPLLKMAKKSDQKEYLQKLENTAMLYNAGQDIDWDSHFSGIHTHHTWLPTYPFEKTKHWLPQPESGKTPFTASALVDTLQAKHREQVKEESLMFIPEWKEQIKLVNSQVDFTSVLIVFTPSSIVLEAAFDEYFSKTTVDHIVKIYLDRKTTQLSKKSWSLDVSDHHAITTCLDSYAVPDCLIFVSDLGIKKVPLSKLQSAYEENELQLLRLTKYLKQKSTTETRINSFYITGDNYRTDDQENHPAGGGVNGLVYSIAQGDHHFLVRNIDISREDISTKDKQNYLVRTILNEAPSERGDLIKLYNGSRYKRFLTEIKIPRGQQQLPLKINGVYVIAGGSGAIGQIITDYLIKNYNADVIWIGRTGKEKNPLQQKIKAYSQYDKLPYYVQADITDEGQIIRAVEEITTNYSHIDGAIFCGLVFNNNNSIESTSENEFLKISDVKVSGIINFYKALKNMPLDFMCIFSSAQAFSFSGAANFSAYATGISFSDVFCNHINKSSEFPVGIMNWGFWRSSMGSDASYKNSGLLEDTEGINCFTDFIELLKARKINQCVCFKTTEHVRTLIPFNTTDYVIPEEKTASLPVNNFLKDPVITNAINQKLEKIQDSTFDEWMVKLLFTQLRQLGILNTQDGISNLKQITEKAGILKKYAAWFTECLRLLHDANYVKVDGDRVRIVRSDETGENKKIWQQWKKAKQVFLRDKDLEAKAKIIEACMLNLPQVITGQIPATSVLFPNGSTQLVEGFYRNNTLSDFCNDLVAETVEAYVREILTGSSEKIRIIEIGAGTGATSQMIFKRLEAYSGHIEFCYTDISQSFLLLAQEQYATKHPYITYQRWNVEKEIEGQGIKIGFYDIVIATNVLHATGNIRKTINHAKSALKTNGVLLLNEITEKTPFTTLTFGLLDGWWLSEDSHLRIEGSPLLSLNTWKRVLCEEGFFNIYTPAIDRVNLAQRVIRAQSNGLIRMPLKNGMETDLKDGSSKKQMMHISDRNVVSQQTDELNSEEYIKRILVTELSISLGIDNTKIDLSTSFSDYGVDSIIGVSFVGKLNEALGIKLNSAILYDYTTVNKLTGFIIKNYRKEIIKIENGPSYTSPSSISMPTVTDEDAFIRDIEEKFFTNKISSELAVQLLLSKFDN